MATYESVEGVPVREGEYGDRVVAVEPGGIEYIPDRERHGNPLKLFWTWMSANLEFATIFVGFLPVAFFGMGFADAAVALILGTALGSLTHAILSSWGPKFGVPQMVQSRGAFGYLGNLLPAGLNTFTATVGWFIVNSVAGAFALTTLFGPRLLNWFDMPFWVAFLVIVLAQVVVAFVGHNLVHEFEKYCFPYLMIVFGLATIWILVQAHLGTGIDAKKQGPLGETGAFTLTFTAAFGYAVGWNPYASDYTRYLPSSTSRVMTGLWAGVVGYIVGIWLQAQVGPGSKYEDFLLLISYWIAPFLAVVLLDYWMRRGSYDERLFYDTHYRPWHGVVAMPAGIVVSFPFWNNPLYTGPLATAVPALGDITFVVGFIVTAVVYFALTAGVRREAPAEPEAATTGS